MIFENEYETIPESVQAYYFIFESKVKLSENSTEINIPKNSWLIIRKDRTTEVMHQDIFINKYRKVYKTVLRS